GTAGKRLLKYSVVAYLKNKQRILSKVVGVGILPLNEELGIIPVSLNGLTKDALNRFTKLNQGPVNVILSKKSCHKRYLAESVVVVQSDRIEVIVRLNYSIHRLFSIISRRLLFPFCCLIGCRRLFRRRGIVSRLSSKRNSCKHHAKSCYNCKYSP